MAKEFAKPFYNSKQWINCRKSFISYRITIDGGMCEHCKESLGYIVDHIEELTPDNLNDPNISLSHNNFQYLCIECHNRKTFGSGEVVREGLMFDDNGELVHTPHKINSI